MIFNFSLHPKTKAPLQFGFCSVLLLMLLAACSTPVSTTESSPTTVETIPESQMEIEPEEASVTSTPSDESRIEKNQLTSPALENNLIGDPSTREFYVYLPPGYDTSEKHYPVVYTLHGYGVSASSMAPMYKKLDELIESGEAQEMILVLVDGDNKFYGSWYLSSPTIGDYETYIASDLVEYIDASYRTIPDRNSRGITGFATGGDGSLHLAFMYPDVFSVAVPMAGYYNFENEIIWEPNKGTLHMPEDFDDFKRLPWELQYLMAGAAAVSSNPDNPPFYLDMPFEVVDGETRLVPEVYEKIIAADSVHAIDAYLNKPDQLRGLMIYHGELDDFSLVESVREFSELLNERGIQHDYLEVRKTHSDLDYTPVLEYFSEHLEN